MHAGFGIGAWHGLGLESAVEFLQNMKAEYAPISYAFISRGLAGVGCPYTIRTNMAIIKTFGREK